MQGGKTHSIHLITGSYNFRGIPGGEENGLNGYMLTFVIAYIRVSRTLVYTIFVLINLAVQSELQGHAQIFCLCAKRPIQTNFSGPFLPGVGP